MSFELGRWKSRCSERTALPSVRCAASTCVALVTAKDFSEAGCYFQGQVGNHNKLWVTTKIWAEGRLCSTQCAQATTLWAPLRHPLQGI